MTSINSIVTGTRRSGFFLHSKIATCPACTSFLASTSSDIATTLLDSEAPSPLAYGDEDHWSRKKGFCLAYICRPHDIKMDWSVSFNLHFLIIAYFNIFDVCGLTFYCTFCKHFGAHAHNVKTHLFYKKHTKNLCTRRGLQFLKSSGSKSNKTFISDSLSFEYCKHLCIFLQLTTDFLIMMGCVIIFEKVPLSLW